MENLPHKLNEIDMKKKLKALTSDAPDDTYEYKYVRTWGIYLETDLFHSIVTKLGDMIKKESFEYICPVPPCGLPLASTLSHALDKKMIVPLPAEFALLGISDTFHNENDIKHGKKVILVDSIINAGGSARNIEEKLRAIDGEFVGLFVVLFNDTFPANRSDRFKKEKKENIKYIYKVSDL
jgi:orotate phosphoribosyltransferase